MAAPPTIKAPADNNLFLPINLSNLGIANFANLRVNLITLPIKNLTNFPSGVVNNNNPPNKAGQKSFKNLTIVSIFFLLLSSPNHSTNLVNALPNKVYKRKFNILSNIPLTGANIFDATFETLETPFSKLLSLDALL